jgi:hypothetical protein
MAQNTQTTPGEQMDLIDVTPEELQRIKPVARKYKKAQRARLAAEKEEVKLVREAKIPRLDDGSIKFSCDGMTVKILPRDELVRVTGVEEDDDDS